MRTVHVDVNVHLTLKLNDDVEVGDFIDEMDYSFSPPEDGNGDIEDSEIVGYSVNDSR